MTVDAADIEEDFRPWRRHALAPYVRDDDDAAWSAFEHYLVSVGRNLGRTARERRALLETVHRWARAYHWRERASAYDAHLEAVRDEAAEASVAELARMCVGMTSLGSREFTLLARAQATLDRPGVIRPSDAIRMVDRGVTLLQLLGGRPTERTATDEPDLSRLTDDELTTLAALRAKMTAPAGD